MKYSRHMAILVGMVFLAFCLAELPGRRVVPAMEKAEDAAEDSMILVEAFMVEVPLSDLYELGLPVVSEGAKSVSAEQILRCLKKPKSGAVTAGAKLAVAERAKATTKTNTIQGVWSGPPEKRRLEFDNFGVSLTVQGSAIPGGKIGLNLEFNHKALDEGDDEVEAQPIVTERNWACGVTLEPGKPTLVGATQDDETAVFLVITAKIVK